MSPATTPSINPATGVEIARYPLASHQELDAAAARAAAAFSHWRKTPLDQRTKLLDAIATKLLDDRDRLAALMTAEMGKPLAESKAEVEKSASVCRYYAEHAATFLKEEHIPLPDFAVSKVSFQPLGTILAIMPWNYPLWQVFRCAAPILAGGNTLILKHASNVSGCSLAMAELFGEVFPTDVFQAVVATGRDTSQLIADPRIHGVTLTGSTAAGKAVAEQAGKHLKKCVLELGGTDAYVVLADADVKAAAEACAASRLSNAGQSCIAPKRLIVHRSLAAEFEQHIIAAFSAAQQGDPRAQGTTLGPMARADLRDELHGLVEGSVAKGARLALGGQRPDGPGAFYPATVLADVMPGMAAFDEELFGPVAAIIPAESDEEAIALANQSEYGLGGGVFTRDQARGEQLATTELDSGAVFVNGCTRSHTHLPFGGIKSSGYGRELGSFGIREFVNIKTVCVKKG